MRLDPADIDATALPFRLPGPAMEGIMTSLEAVGTVLTEWAAGLGVQILRGAAVEAVTQDGDTVVTRAAWARSPGALAGGMRRRTQHGARTGGL